METAIVAPGGGAATRGVAWPSWPCTTSRAGCPCHVAWGAERRSALKLDGGVHSQIDQMRKDAAKEDFLRTLGIRLLRLPNAMVLEHPDEFGRKVVGAMGAVAEKVRK